MSGAFASVPLRGERVGGPPAVAPLAVTDEPCGTPRGPKTPTSLRKSKRAAPGTPRAAAAGTPRVRRESSAGAPQGGRRASVRHRASLDISGDTQRRASASESQGRCMGWMYAHAPGWLLARLGAYSQFAQYMKDGVTESDGFQSIITLFIVIAGVLVGLQTYPLSDGVASVADTLDTVVVWVFVVECGLKIVAEGTAPWAYFQDPWNCFDFFIVAVGLLPFGGDVKVLRLLRLLRLMKLVRALPQLQIIVVGLLKSFSSIGYIALLLMLLFYLWASLGVTIFGANDPFFYGNLHTAFVSLFQAATGDDWTEMMYTAMYGCDSSKFAGVINYGDSGNARPGSECVDPGAYGVASVIYFVSFQILGALVLLNLFVGVVVMSIIEAKVDSMSGEILFVTLHSASDLIIADPSFGVGLGSSDPYAIISVGKMTKKSKRFKRTLNPVWEQKFQFFPLEKLESNTLVVKLMDWDMFGEHDNLGYCEFDVAEIPFGEEVEMSCKLIGVDHGTVNFTVMKRMSRNSSKRSNSRLTALVEDTRDLTDRMSDVRALLVTRGKFQAQRSKNRAVGGLSFRPGMRQDVSTRGPRSTKLEDELERLTQKSKKLAQRSRKRIETACTQGTLRDSLMAQAVHPDGPSGVSSKRVSTA